MQEQQSKSDAPTDLPLCGAFTMSTRIQGGEIHSIFYWVWGPDGALASAQT